MRITILTQDDPFFLAKNIDYLIRNLPEGNEIVATVLFDVSPFGKRETFKEKAEKTLSIFGLRFFIYYSLKFVFSKLNPKNSIKNVLDSFQIPILQLNGSVNSKENLDIIASYKPDLLISIGGNQIFKKPLINLAPKGCLNLHSALLPKYRGLMPSFWVLKNDEKYTGVSVFFVDEGIDSGPIIIQDKLEIDGRSQEDLIKTTKQMGMDAIIKAISLIQSGKYNLIPNEDSEKTYYSFPTKEDVKEFYRKKKHFF